MAIILSDYIKRSRLFERLDLVVPAPDVERVLADLRDPVKSSGHYVIWSGELMQGHPFYAAMCDWQADHIVEVTDGGTPYLENIQTLCLPCHKAKTKASHGQRAAMRRAQKQPPLTFSAAVTQSLE